MKDQPARETERLIAKVDLILQSVLDIEATLDEASAIEGVVEHLSELGYPHAMVSLLDDTETPPVIRAVSATGDDWRAIMELTVRRFPGPDILAKVLADGQPRYVADSRKDPDWDRAAVAIAGIVSQYVIPLMTRDSRIGALQVDMGDTPTHLRSN